MENVRKEFLKELNTEIYFNTMDKFKTSTFEITYRFHKDEVDIATLNLLALLLADSCKDYPTTPLLSSRLEELYGSAISPKVSVSGDIVSFNIQAAFISDFYAEKGLSDKVIELAAKLIYEPNFVKSKFEKSYFEFEKSKLVASSLKTQERKESCAELRFNELLEKECGTKNPMLITKKLEKVTLNNVMNMYEKLLNTNYVILVVGDLDEEEIKQSFIKYFKKTVAQKEISLIHPVNKEIKNKTEKNEKFSQSVLFTVFDINTNILSNDLDHY